MKDYERGDLEIKIKELKDLDNQYFDNIIKLLRVRGNLIILCAFELIVIVLLLLFLLL